MVDWNDLDDMVLHAVEGNIDGEPIIISPRISGEFSEYSDDLSRPSIETTGTFSENNARERVRGDATGINTNAYLALSKTVITIRKSFFSSTSDWPRQNDAILRVRTNERFCITIVEDNAAAINLVCCPEG